MFVGVSIIIVLIEMALLTALLAIDITFIDDIQLWVYYLTSLLGSEIEGE